LQRPHAISLADYKVMRRNGAVVGFEPGKIVVAMSKAFIAVRGGQGAASAAIREQVEALTSSVVAALLRRQPAGGTFHIEDIQDQVELSLMRAGAHEVARAYVLYREQRARERARQREEQRAALAELTVLDGERRFALDRTALRSLIQASCDGLDAAVSADAVVNETLKNLYDGIPLAEVHKSAILAARALVETDPDYGRLSAGRGGRSGRHGAALRRLLSALHPGGHRGRAAG
jgi:ribonucleoside-diphosphate reductase alpha chain